jgi:putative hydrolase of the HAD superfamily
MTVVNRNKIPKGTKAVFFDAGGTLFRPFPSVGHHYSAVAARYGCRVSEQDVEAAFRRVWHDHDRIGDLKSHMNEKNEKEFWRRVVTEVFKDAGSFTSFDDFFSELHDLFARPEVWKFFPDAEEVLQELKNKGYILGLVSNWDSRLVKLCKGLGLDRFMDFTVISAVFGAAKPDPKIFREALRLAGVKADEAVHIGDSLEDDIRGAHLAGIKAIWIDRSARHGELTKEHQDLVSVVRDLRELI